MILLLIRLKNYKNKIFIMVYKEGNIEIFKEYALYYNMFNQDKDYKKVKEIVFLLK